MTLYRAINFEATKFKAFCHLILLILGSTLNPHQNPSICLLICFSSITISFTKGESSCCINGPHMGWQTGQVDMRGL